MSDDRLGVKCYFYIVKISEARYEGAWARRGKNPIITVT